VTLVFYVLLKLDVFVSHSTTSIFLSTSAVTSAMQIRSLRYNHFSYITVTLITELTSGVHC